MYEHGRGVAQDNAEAEKWYRLAAEQGNDMARKNLSDLLSTAPAPPAPPNAVAAQNVEFIFSGQGVTSSRGPSRFIRVGEGLSIYAPKDRLASYSIQISNECDGYRLIIERDRNSIRVFYDAEKQRIIGAGSWGEGSMDTAVPATRCSGR